ncbi:unnamed protein product [Coffea canephora]|uniref:Serine-threonine/tyrosine-protein kinase catalytic domain-containing protein n=1 Tax=Coffea canephora TaxID=49390 RepID=A0A068V1C7_COFCA|nr:unnamed protein product [Coffea canephora]
MVEFMAKTLKRAHDNILHRPMAKLNYLRQLCHPYLMKLVGHCLEDELRLLVNDFMPSGAAYIKHGILLLTILLESPIRGCSLRCKRTSFSTWC